jgi:hypothetical protein
MDIDGYANTTRCTSIRGSRREIAATSAESGGVGLSGSRTLAQTPSLPSFESGSEGGVAAYPSRRPISATVSALVASRSPEIVHEVVVGANYSGGTPQNTR